MLELGLGIAPRQVALLNVFDKVPANVQMTGYVPNSHAPRHKGNDTNNTKHEDDARAVRSSIVGYDVCYIKNNFAKR